MYPLKDKMAIIRDEIAKYAVDGINVQSHLTQNEDATLFAVIDLSIQGGKRFADASLIVRIEDERVIIEHDMNDKPLVDALTQAGIPRRRIILAYAGELIPENGKITGTWQDFVQNLTETCEFFPSVTEEDIKEVEISLKVNLPNDLRTLLLETNGIYDTHAKIHLIWTLEEIARMNLLLRTQATYAKSYMPLNHLLFFANMGIDDILLAFPIAASGDAKNKDIIAWYPIEDSRPVIAFSLKHYLQSWISGKLKL